MKSRELLVVKVVEVFCALTFGVLFDEVQIIHHTLIVPLSAPIEDCCQEH